MPATINGTTGFGGNLTGNVTGNVTGTSSAVADGAVSAAKLDGAQTGSAPIYGCRAWVNFDGTTTPPTIRASGNVSGVTRNSTGNYTVTFATAMQDANYSATVSTNSDFVAPTSFASSSVVFLTTNGAFQPLNASIVNVAIFR